MNIILRDLKEVWKENISPLFLQKKGVSIWMMRPNLWDNFNELFWPSKPKPKTYTEKLIEACR